MVSLLPRYPWPHCGGGTPCTMGAAAGERCACSCRGCRAARWGVTRSGIYRDHWQWVMPWGVTDWWRIRSFKGADEWCCPSVCLVVPPLGCLVLFWTPTVRRVMPCPEDWAQMGEWQRADYAPCGKYHGGRINWDAHDHLDGACEEARAWLAGQAA